MTTAVLSVVGLLMALYLWLWKIGVVGTIACGQGGGCAVVQTSEYAEFLGLPVALYGVGGYLALLVVSMIGLHEPWASRKGPTVWLAVLSGVGVAFTIYLTYLEAAVIGAWCRWCVGSAVIITGIFAVAVLGLRQPAAGTIPPALRTSPSAPPPHQDPPAS